MRCVRCYNFKCTIDKFLHMCIHPCNCSQIKVEDVSAHQKAEIEQSLSLSLMRVTPKPLA